MSDMERWAPVVGFKDYEISSLGRLRSITPRKGSRAKVNGGIIVGWIQRIHHNYSRRMYALRKDGKTYYKKAHQLVLNAFIGPGPKGQESLHINGKSLENNLSNLRYGTRKENHLDSVRHGTHLKPPIHFGESNSNARLSSAQVDVIRSFEPCRGLFVQLAREYNTTPTTIQRIREGKTRTKG